MTRPIVYDATHLVTRLRHLGATGIDAIDLAYARHFSEAGRPVCGAHVGLRHPHLYSAERLRAIVADIDARRDRARDGAQPSSLFAWLAGEAPPPAGATKAPRRFDPAALLRQASLRLAHDKSETIAEGAIYLAVAQHVLEFPLFFDWLSKRSDIRPVFFVHDLLPLDHPEFFRKNYRALFARRLRTLMRHAAGLIVTTNSVGERLAREYADCGRAPPPIHVAPPPSPLAAMDDGPPLAMSAAPFMSASSPYFVAIGTIEPRKNHPLLLNLWRALAERSKAPPKLVLVGADGWESAQTLEMIARSRLLAPHLKRVSGVAPRDLRRLLRGARALLAPSFAEGYGVPLVEALSEGVPVVASDIPVFHEVTQERALFVSPIDGLGWLRAVEALCGETEQSAQRRVASQFVAPAWRDYFDALETFLARL